VGKVSKLSLTIDNRKVTTEEGSTILQAAQSAGIDIPTLCYHEKLAPRGACRLCLVEITKGQRKRLVTSCVYLAEEGLKVETESEPVVRIRKMLLELMLASSPGVKAIQDYARRYGITRSRFDIEPDFCILCGLCVRYCNEVKGKNAIGFVGRGTQRKVMFFPDIAAEECPKCGECFPLCPTGVIPSNYALAKLPHFTYDNIRL
jgi:bidirectional [NiFe] hydrogenase diaphorase subunit